MTKVTSVPFINNGKSNSEIQASFSLFETSIASMKVSDKLLTNLEVAECRARAELLKNGYIANRVSISTYHINDIELGHIISLNDVLYFVDSIKEYVLGAEVSMTLVLVRYER